MTDTTVPMKSRVLVIRFVLWALKFRERAGTLPTAHDIAQRFRTSPAASAELAVLLGREYATACGSDDIPHVDASRARHETAPVPVSRPAPARSVVACATGDAHPATRFARLPSRACDDVAFAPRLSARI